MEFVLIEACRPHGSKNRGIPILNTAREPLHLLSAACPGKLEEGMETVEWFAVWVVIRRGCKQENRSPRFCTLRQLPGKHHVLRHDTLGIIWAIC